VLTSWIGIIGLLMQVGVSQPPGPLSVAEVVNNSTRYADRTVIVAGLLMATDEVTALKGDTCEVRVGALKRPFACAVSLLIPNCKDPEQRCSQELLNVVSAIRRVRSLRENSVTMVSLTGTLVLPPTVFVEHAPLVPGLPKGEYAQTGFGHMNAFPVQLIVVDGRVLSHEESSRPRDAKPR
jgi:hypothetical protein